MTERWRIEYWYTNGVHLGWRIVRGHGVDLEIHKTFKFDHMIDGDYLAKQAETADALRELNED